MRLAAKAALSALGLAAFGGALYFAYESGKRAEYTRLIEQDEIALEANSERESRERAFKDILDCEDDKEKKAGGWHNLSTFQRKEIGDSCHKEYSEYQARRLKEATDWLTAEAAKADGLLKKATSEAGR
jgi:hypothetical protein